MNTPLHTVDHVRLDTGIRVVDITIGRSGVIVVLHDLAGQGYHARQLQWEQISDVELISTMFDQETVRTFRVLVERLGSIAAAQNIYQCIT